MNVKKHIDKILKQKSGRRFRFSHFYLRALLGTHALTKIILIALSVISIIIGIILLFLPGPGLLFIAIGLMFLAVLSIGIAKNLDKLEVWLRKKYEEMRDFFSE